MPLTWNLNKSQAALNFGARLSERDFTKCPSDRGASGDARRNHRSERAEPLQASTEGGDANPIGYRTGAQRSALQPIGSVVGDVDGEFVAQKFCHTAGDREFWLVSIHATSQATDEVDTLEGRGGCRALLRHRINEIYGSDPIVMLGDFNSEASSNEIN